MDGPVELAPLEVEWESLRSNTLLTRTERPEVLCRLGGDILEELKDDATSWRTADFDIEEHAGVSRRRCCCHGEKLERLEGRGKERRRGRREGSRRLVQRWLTCNERRRRDYKRL